MPPYMPAMPKQDGMQGSPGAHAYANAPLTDIQTFIAHIRQHEYPSFMSFHALQGIPQQQAHAMYMEYEHMRVTRQGGSCGSG